MVSTKQRKRIREFNNALDNAISSLNKFAEQMDIFTERLAIMNEPEYACPDDIIFPPLDDELNREGD